MGPNNSVSREEIYNEITDEDTLKNRYLTFTIGEEDYGISIEFVTEIIGIQKISPVPDMPDFVKGVINLRGQVIPVMDVRNRFHMASREYDERTCVIVVKIHDASVGIVVDTVKEVVNISEKNVSPPPRIAKSDTARYIQGIGKVGDEVKILLNVHKLLFDEDKEIINNLSSGM